jgi:phosphatidylserine/phosphatidylglycerophosphate/cardiolipin synthase-like enzyme
MARAIARARRFVYLAGWALRPDLRPPQHTRSWGSLLADAARRADVRILISDIDPVGNPGRHRDNWRAYRSLIALQQASPRAGRQPFEVMVSLHSLFVDLNFVTGLPGGKELFQLLAPRATARLRGAIGSAQELKDRPLLWRNVRRRLAKAERGGKTPPATFELAPFSELDLVVYPATHHQKLCIVDGTVAFAGGIDIAELRDDPAAWRDVHCRLEGGIVRDLEASFVERWNRERVRFERFLAKANHDLAKNLGRSDFELPAGDGCSALALSRPEVAPTVPVRTSTAPAPAPSARNSLTPVAPPPPGSAVAQVQRTISRLIHRDEDLDPGGARAFAVPLGALQLERPRTDVSETYARAIGCARQLIYLENQYIREPRLAALIAARLRAAPALRVILAVPRSVEEKDDLLTPHGNALQSQIVRRLDKAFRGSTGQFAAFRVRGPYLHSKVLLVDDVFASIGSANANPRSFGLDTELDIVWRDPASVAAFRVRLWSGLLGAPRGLAKLALADSVAFWRQTATAGRGLISPYTPLRPCGPGVSPCEQLNPALALPLLQMLV